MNPSPPWGVTIRESVTSCQARSPGVGGSRHCPPTRAPRGGHPGGGTAHTRETGRSPRPGSATPAAVPARTPTPPPRRRSRQAPPSRRTPTAAPWPARSAPVPRCGTFPQERPHARSTFPRERPHPPCRQGPRQPRAPPPGGGHPRPPGPAWHPGTAGRGRPSPPFGTAVAPTRSPGTTPTHPPRRTPPPGSRTRTPPAPPSAPATSTNPHDAGVEARRHARRRRAAASSSNRRTAATLDRPGAPWSQ